MDRVEFTVVSQASPQLVWEQFSDIQVWRKISPWYGEIRWVQGEPWRPGSRISAVLAPRAVLMEYAVIHCEPARQVGVIIRGEHIAIERWIDFVPEESGGTLLRTWAEFTGTTIQATEKPFIDHLRDFTEDWYRCLALHCDRLAEQFRGKSPGSVNPPFPASA